MSRPYFCRAVKGGEQATNSFVAKSIMSGEIGGVNGGVLTLLMNKKGVGCNM
jgi:hypothetical protein